MMKIVFTTLFFSSFLITMAQNKLPVAPKSTKNLTIHNHTRVDDYYWMNERDSKAVLDYLKEENEFSENYFKPLEGMVVD